MSTHTRDSTEQPDAYEEYAPRIRPWWVPWLVALLVAALIIGVGSYFVYGRDAVAASMDTDAGVPPVRALYQDEEILFLHTEASDPKAAQLLTDMMDSPVFTVPELATVPDAALDDVFVFTNGVEGPGPMGFQPDVFDSVPGDDDYTPLRALHLVTWSDNARPRVLTSAQDVRAAQEAGEVSIERPGVVINMPIVKWPGGER